MTVSAVVVNYNGATWLGRCLESLLGQSHAPAEVLVVDNDSVDDSVSVVRQAFPQVRLVQLARNIGYAGAANVAVRETSSPYLLLLNPDVVLTPRFLEVLVGFAASHPEAGSYTGKLLRLAPGLAGPVIDSTGHLLFRSRWVVNRGEGQPDRGQYDTPAEVFGVSGAAALYRREMLEDVQVGGEVFAESFFLYLEDVDLDWRAQLRGWKAFCVPAAVAYHERGYKAELRPRDARILRHSLKNRYLMVIRNDDVGSLLRDAWAVLPVELLRFVDFLLTAPSSLAGYVDAIRLLPETLRQRRAIRRRRRVPPGGIRRWLRGSPSRGALLERARLRLAARDRE